MFQSKPKLPTQRVWRISASAPKGEWVVKGVPVVTKPQRDLPEVSYGTWVTSSYDLLDGTDVTEDPSTIPGELFDELFAANPGDTKKAPD